MAERGHRFEPAHTVEAVRGQKVVGDEEGIKTQFLGPLGEAPDAVRVLGIVRRQQI
jgi:hypothetical protein